MVYRPKSLLERLELLRQYGFISGSTCWTMCCARHEVVSDSYEEIVTNAHRHALISSDLYGALRGLGGFRDVLAHEYVGLADATVHEHLVKMNGVFRALTRELEMLVESGDAG